MRGEERNGPLFKNLRDTTPHQHSEHGGVKRHARNSFHRRIRVRISRAGHESVARELVENGLNEARQARVFRTFSTRRCTVPYPQLSTG
jgi:hypothetical protein